MAWKNVQYENGKYRTSEGGGGGGSSTFAGLDDVSFDNLQNGQVPKYNSETQKWENADESGGGGTVTDVQVDGVSVVNQQGVAEIEMPTPPSVPGELSDLSDVQFSNLTDHQPLRYNATSQKWVNGADNYPPLIYSDEEREVGVWRDGKPLYQKTFSTNITSATQWIMTGLTNVERVITSEGSMINSNNEPRTLPSADSSSIAGINTFIFSNGELACLFRTNNSDMRGDLKLTLRYTKTTDTAGSGTWTTQGGYAHHYSTTEHVIGTFFGKPLYERSWTLPSEITIIPSSWTSLGIPNTNIDLIVNAIGTSEWGISRIFSVSSKVDSTNIVALCTRGGNDTLKYVTLQYTKTTD